MTGNIDYKAFQDRIAAQEAQKFDLPPIAGGGGSDGTSDEMEVRVAKLESDVGHIQKDIAEIKSDVRELRTGIGKLNTDLATLTAHVSHLPTKGFIVTAVVTSLAVLGALIIFQGNLQKAVGIAPSQLARSAQ